MRKILFLHKFDFCLQLRKIGLLFAFLFASLTAFTQPDNDQQLAQQYYYNREFDKAAVLFEKLYNKNESQFYYKNLFNCYVALSDWKSAEKLVTKRQKKYGDDITLLVDLGYLNHQQNNAAKGNEAYQNALKNLQTNDGQIRLLANTFLSYNELPWSIKTYEQGRKMLANPAMFCMELASVYERANDFKNAIFNYLDCMSGSPFQTENIKAAIQRSIDVAGFKTELENQLYSRIQKQPEVIAFSELLIWLFLRQKDFENAFIQVRALDRRLKEDGRRMMQLAETARTEKNFSAAIKALEYVLEKGKNNPLYVTARQDLLLTRKEAITATYDYTPEDLLALDADYKAFIAEFGNNAGTAKVVRERARLFAYYLYDYEKAIELLDQLIQQPYLEKTFAAEVKLDLGDFYLISGDVWESSLLYSQVDKAMKDEPLGELARFKNAKLAYFRGEFEWAQTQLNVLKSATSDVISNDAIALSVFILDNLGLDTTMIPMLMFARADLLTFQNRLEEGLQMFDSLHKMYPWHDLSDDILYAKANIYLKKRQFEKAAASLDKILNQYSDKLLADDATFLLAEINEKYLGNKERAMELYQRLLLEYKDSLRIVEARKRFRQLRGDLVN